MKTKIILIALFLLTFIRFVHAQQAITLYWTSPQGVFSASLPDAQPQDIATVTLGEVNTIVVDTLNKKLYWADGVLGKVMRSDLEGTNQEILFNEGKRNFQGQKEPRGLAVDVTDEKIYWAAEFGQIKRASLDGSNEELVIDSAELRITDIALDPIRGLLYWVGSEELDGPPFLSPLLRRSNLDGSNAEDIELFSEDGMPVSVSILHIELDLVNDALYMASSTKVFRASIDGNNLKELIADTGRTEGFAIDVKQNAMYWTADNFGRGQLKRADLDGNNEEVIGAIEVGDLSGVAVDYQAGVLYWANGFTREVFSANLDGTDTKLLITNDHYFPRDIAWHSLTEEVFWTDSGNASVFKFDPEKNVTESVISRPFGSDSSSISGLFSLALDVDKSEVYWTAINSDRVSFIIQRANLDGNQIESVLTPEDGVVAANHIDLDPSERFMYWSHFTENGSIHRASMDGGPPESILPNAFSSGLAVDSVAKKIYWTQDDVIYRGVMRADLDGSNAERVVVESDDTLPSGIALDLVGQKMYWTDSMLNLIKRANLDGTEVEHVLRVFQPRGIAIGYATSNTTIDDRKVFPGLNIQTYPNPFSTYLTFQYTLNRYQRVHIAIYDLLGREIDVVLNDWQSAGQHQLGWTGKDVPSGIYLMKIEVPGEQMVRSIIKL